MEELSIAERYQYLIRCYAGGNQREFSDMCGISIYAISRIVQNKYKGTALGKTYVNRILDAFPEVNEDWLMTGKGEPGVSPRAQVVTDFRAEIERLNAEIAALQHELELSKKIIEKLIEK